MKLTPFMLTLIILLFGGNYSFSDEGAKHEEHIGSPAGGQEGIATVSTAVEVGNRVCPVSGNKVDDGKMGEAIKYEYNGKLYNLCCKMCVKDFQKDPQKYSKIAEDEAAKEQGMTQDPAGDSFVRHEGHLHGR